jgi:hypothetical protein
MPSVKIIEKGFEGYNGIIEGVQFDNGVSGEPMSQFSAERIGAFMKVVDADTDEPLGLGYRMANARGSTGVAPRKPLERVVRTKTGKEKKSLKPTKLISYDFTKDELEGIADKGGINALRKVADQYDVRGRSIAEIIDSLMGLKANQEAKDNAAIPRPKEPEPAIDDDSIDSLIEG